MRRETSPIRAVQPDTARCGICRHYSTDGTRKPGWVFSLGFARQLIQNSYRLSYLRDAQTHPDGDPDR